MNREEFYNIVQAELDKLLEEKKEIRAVLNYYDIINEDGSYDKDYFYHEQRKQPEYKLKLCEAKIEKVKELLGYPLYVRISSMSDLELEEYKKQSIEEIVSKINELKKEIKYEENEVNELKNRQKQIISKLSSTSDKEREEARIEAKEIFNELKKYNMTPVYGCSFEERIQQLEKQIELLNKKTPNEIRDELLSRVPNNGIHINTETRENKDYSNFVADVAEDYDRTEKMIDLTLKKQNLEQDSLNRINSSNDYQEITTIIDRLPKSFKYGLSVPLNKNILDKKTIHQFLNDIYEYEKKCKEVEEAFINNFCMNSDGIRSNDDILSLIEEKQFLKNTSNYTPLNFFSEYKDRILSYSYTNLVTLFREKDELSKKAYAKFGNTKSKIQKLEQDIRDLENSIFCDIRTSYIDDLSDIFDIFTPFELQIPTDGSSEFFNTRHDPAVVSSMKHLFDRCENIAHFINKVIDEFYSIKENLDKIRKILAEERKMQKDEEKEINSINDEIRNISDVDADVPYMGRTKEEIEDFIIYNAAKKKQDEVATKVETAKIESDNLEGLNPEYLEELKKLKEVLKEKSTQEFDNEEKLNKPNSL